MRILEVIGAILSLWLIGGLSFLGLGWAFLFVLNRWLDRTARPQPGRRKRHLPRIKPEDGWSFAIPRSLVVVEMAEYGQQARDSAGIQAQARRPSWWRSHLVALGYGLGVLLLALASWRLLQPDAEAGVSGLRLVLLLALWVAGGSYGMTTVLPRLTNLVEVSKHVHRIVVFVVVAILVLLVVGLASGWYGGHEPSQEPTCGDGCSDW